jgi:hypothetical protein
MLSRAIVGFVAPYHSVYQNHGQRFGVTGVTRDVEDLFRVGPTKLISPATPGAPAYAETRHDAGIPNFESSVSTRMPHPIATQAASNAIPTDHRDGRLAPFGERLIRAFTHRIVMSVSPRTSGAS